ncbi:hypothetical protein [Nostoc sp. 106C]|uniref:hypothetical protein n=1 Tax=Nostoc sp. 106C TaxID=1932667 RepID=UPI000A3695A3|nr:hypothetical protein [Nostoc sp. 106C]OUL27612.1 hypothetical protein BV375_19630 [Nostoc sp. 106C]
MRQRSESNTAGGFPALKQVFVGVPPVVATNAPLLKRVYSCPNYDLEITAVFIYLDHALAFFFATPVTTTRRTYVRQKNVVNYT